MNRWSYLPVTQLFCQLCAFVTNLTWQFSMFEHRLSSYLLWILPYEDQFLSCLQIFQQNQTLLHHYLPSYSPNLNHLFILHLLHLFLLLRLHSYWIPLHLFLSPSQLLLPFLHHFPMRSLSLIFLPPLLPLSLDFLIVLFLLTLIMHLLLIHYYCFLHFLLQALQPKQVQVRFHSQQPKQLLLLLLLFHVLLLHFLLLFYLHPSHLHLHL